MKKAAHSRYHPVVAKKLTARQASTLGFIQRYILEHNHGPTLEEISQGCQLGGIAGAHRMVRVLVENGYLEHPPGSRRTIKVVDNAPSEVALPLASAPELNIPSLGRELFALHVTGDSMVDANVFEGDIVVVDRQREARSGDMVVALVRGEEATLKRLQKNASNVELIPANPNYPVQTYPLHDVQVQGVAVALIRNY